MNEAQAETITEQGSTTPTIENRPAQRPRREWIGLLRAELEPFWLSLRSPLFYLSLLIAFLALAAAYQLPFSKGVNLDAPGDAAYLVDYYSREQYKDFVYRWAKPSSNVVLPGTGQPPIVRIKLELSPRPAGAPSPNIDMHVNGDLFRTVELDPNNRKLYELTYYPASRPPLSLKRGDLDFWMTMPYFLAKGDSRPLGVVVSQIQIDGSGIFETGRPTIPPWGTVALLLGFLAGLGLAARRAGWGSWGAAIIIVMFAAPLVVGVAIDRALVGLSAPVLLGSVALAYLFMLTGLLFVGWWLRLGRMDFTVRQARWLGVIFVLAFTVKAAGINHPSFKTLDHGFRLNEVYALLDDPSQIVSRYYNINTYTSVGSQNGEVRAVELGQWEVAVAMPYSPMFYLTDFPLGSIFRQDRSAFLYWTNIYALWWEATAIFLLYIIARQALGGFGNVSGLVAGVLFGFFPLTFLQPSDGGYPSMQAQWLTLFFIMLMTGWFRRRQAERLPLGWRSILGGGVVLGIAMLSHTATMLLLTGFMVLLIVLLWLWGGRYRYLSKPLSLVTGVGLALSFGLYYGFYVWPLLTQTLPTLVSKVGQGEKVGARSQTINGFWSELSAHFHLFPFFITLAALAYVIYTHWRGSRRPTPARDNSFGFTVASEISRPVVLLLVAWFGTFLVFSAVATRINLLNKHMLFAIPLFALGCGLALALLLEAARRWSERATPDKLRWSRLALRSAQLAIVLISVYFFSAGAYTWFQRVVNYVLPAGTG